MRLPSARWAILTVAAVLTGAFLILPTLIVVPMSFNDSSTLGTFDGSWSLQWYRDLFGSPEWRLAAANSLQVALGTTVAATVLGTLAAWGFSKMRGMAQVFRAGSLAPVIIPPIILGVGLYSVFLTWQLTGSILGLVIAHTVLALPFVVIAVGASFAQLDPVYERAAESLGATSWQRLRAVVLPLVLPGVVAGALFAFVTSWDEVVVSIFLTDASTRTLPVEMWIQVRTQVTPTLAALGTCLLLISSLALIAMHVLRRNDRHV
jgi:putative spermidine/putrescine transport system permease protein